MIQPPESVKVSLCDVEKMFLAKEYVVSEPRKKLLTA